MQDLFERARAWSAQGKIGEAEGALRELLRQDADEPLVYRELAGLIVSDNRYPEAMELLERAVAYAPDEAEGWRQLGAAYATMGFHAESARALERAMKLSPRSPAVCWNYAFTLLREGRWREAFPLYEYGFVLGRRRMRTVQPAWDGERDLTGKTLFVWAEQGLGDTIMCLRFLQEVLTPYDCRIILEVQSPLVPLVHDCPYAVVHKQTTDQSIPYDFDEHISLMSLIGALGVTPETIPWSGPYIFSHSEAHEYLMSSLPNIGLCRAGSPSHSQDKNRSLNGEMFKPILEAGVGAFYNLTFGEDDFGGLRDMEKVADVIRHLDLVITVDTAIAHLAGAMGKPVWTLLAVGSDWRWGRDSETTRWYPSMRLFRQERFGDWGPVMDRVADALEAWYE